MVKCKLIVAPRRSFMMNFTRKSIIMMCSLFLLTGCSDGKITAESFSNYFQASAKIKNLWTNCNVDMVFSSSAIGCTVKEDVHISANFDFVLKDGTFLEKTNTYEFVLTAGSLSCTQDFKYTISYSTSDKIEAYGKQKGYTFYEDGVVIKTNLINASGKVEK